MGSAFGLSNSLAMTVWVGLCFTAALISSIVGDVGAMKHLHSEHTDKSRYKNPVLFYLVPQPGLAYAKSPFISWQLRRPRLKCSISVSESNNGIHRRIGGDTNGWT